MKKLLYHLFVMLLSSSFLYGQQSVQLAIDNTDTRFIKEWIQSGHDVNSIIDIEGQKMTALSYASLKANPEMVSLLINKGAHVNAKIEFQDALMYAATGGNVEVIEMLLAAGANPMNENKIGKCARDLAKDAGHSSAFSLLAEETEKRLAAIRSQKRK